MSQITNKEEFDQEVEDIWDSIDVDDMGEAPEKKEEKEPKEVEEESAELEDEDAEESEDEEAEEDAEEEKEVDDEKALEDYTANIGTIFDESEVSVSDTGSPAAKEKEEVNTLISLEDVIADFSDEDKAEAKATFEDVPIFEKIFKGMQGAKKKPEAAKEEISESDQADIADARFWLKTDELHEGSEKTFKSNGYQNWLNGQSSAIKTMAAKGSNDDVVMTIKAFEKAKIRVRAEQEQEKIKVKAKRKTKKSGIKRTKPKGKIVMDDQQAFDDEWNKA